MVSALWKAAAEPDAQKLAELLKDATQIDIEIKDHTGVTPLIQAVRAGHLDNVKELLARGADPANASSQGKPETYTQDPAILECLKAIPMRPNGYHLPQLDPSSHLAPDHQEPHPPYDPAAAAAAAAAVGGYPPVPPNGYWYMPPNGYPPYGYPIPPPQDGMPQHPMSGYYGPPPPLALDQQQQQQNQPPQDGSQPPHPSQQPSSQQQQQQQYQNGGSPTMHIPPEVARTIPCRYFPMCRFGVNCMFAHPNPAGYYPGPPPPMQYPGGGAAYGDPSAAMNHPAAAAPYAPPHQPGYYAVPPPHQAFGPPPPQPAQAPSPNGVGGGPHSPVQHTAPYSAPPVVENGVNVPPQLPPPVPYVMTAGPYPPSGPQMMGAPPGVAIPVVPFPPQGGPPSPTNHRKESSGAASYANGYGQPQTPASAGPQENGVKPFGGNDGENSRPFPPPRNDYGRRSGFRRISFGGPKQPCLFFPAGKCKNGTECRFPHVRPEDDPAAFGPDGYPPPTFPQRSGPRQHARSLHTQRSFNSREQDGGEGRMMNGSGFRKNFSPQDRPYNGNGFNKFGPRNGGPPPKVSVNGNNGTNEKLPSPADFPSLNGRTSSVTPPAPNGATGMTAAQVLKRPAPGSGATTGLEESMAGLKVNGGGSGSKEGGAGSRAESPDLPAPVFPSISDPPSSRVIAAA